jgi:tRNA-uridine 2-sulfurtransferase
LQPGPVFDQQGREIGSHSGLIHYTPGQRKGFSVQTTKRLFVLAKDPGRNALIVGEHDQVMRQTIQVVDLVWSGMAN